MFIKSALLSCSLLSICSSAFPQLVSDEMYWRSITEIDLRGAFIFYEKCPEKAQLDTTVIERSELQSGIFRSVERWTFTGCEKVREYQVTFYPDLYTGSSYRLWPK